MKWEGVARSRRDLFTVPIPQCAWSNEENSWRASEFLVFWSRFEAVMSQVMSRSLFYCAGTLEHNGILWSYLARFNSDARGNVLHFTNSAEIIRQ